MYRVWFALLACALLVACAPAKVGETLMDKTDLDDALTGRAVDQAFERFCESENACGPGQVCVDNRCVLPPNEEQPLELMD